MTATPSKEQVHPELIHGVADKEEFQKQIVSMRDNRVLKQLRVAIERKRAAILAKEESEANYNEPSWACHQAHLNGNKQTLKWIESLLGFVNQ